jgi:uncharacterized membrane protein YhaH (DUF805 family)
VSRRTASLLAWSMCALSLALTALSLFLLVLNLSYPGVPVYPFWAENTVVAIGFSPVGAVIASRISPKNPIGWLFCATGLLFVVSHFSAEYAIYAVLAAPGSLPAGEAAAWILSLVWVPAVGLLVFIGLLFPDGRLPSPRWRWFFWLSLLLILGGAILHAFASGTVFYLGGIYNPLGVEELPTSSYVGDLLQMLLPALILVSVASLLVRRLRATGVERQQLKWFTYATTVTVIGVALTYVISEASGSVLLGWAGYVLGLVGFLGIPISMGIAILRYRLYNIDLIINRTLVYASLTATLAFSYFGSVTLLQYLFSLLTGQANTLAIVASTLAIAALFNPLRRRIQSFIDRRFYRRKYDARKTLEAFGIRLRDETDLEKLCEDLAEVVDETMQPSHISLWLKFPSFSPSNRSESSSEVRSSKQSEPPPQ